MTGVSGSEPDRTQEQVQGQAQEQPPVPAPEPGGDDQPLPEFRGLVTLGSEDAPACSDGICF